MLVLSIQVFYRYRPIQVYCTTVILSVVFDCDFYS